MYWHAFLRNPKTEAFCEGLETAGHEYGVYEVCKMNIHGCLACEYCHTKGNGQCVQKDDMQYVYHVLKLW